MKGLMIWRIDARDFLFRHRTLILSLLIIVLCLCGWVTYAFWWANTWEGPEERVFFVSKGETFASIVDSLEADGIIRSRALFVFIAKVTGGTSHMQVGKYVFRNGVDNITLYRQLRTGRGTSLIAVTVPEGFLSRQQAHLFARAVGLDSARFVDLVQDEGFTRSLGVEASSLEGYLFPDTYDLPWEPDEKEVIRTIVSEFERFFSDTLEERANSLGWTTNQVLTLASIVEGESRVAHERPIIAGVYRNRLRKGMRLEADPTIQFILSDGPRRILYDDLHIESRYNTYRYAGLPPGPVNNPGRASILAALYPAEHGYLYFVANGSGGHMFSRTFEEHQRQARMYRRVRARQRAEMLRDSLVQSRSRE